MADLVGRCFGYSAFLTFLFCSFFWLFAARGQTWHGQLFWSLKSPWLKSHAADVQKSDPIWCTPWRCVRLSVAPFFWILEGARRQVSQVRPVACRSWVLTCKMCLEQELQQSRFHGSAWAVLGLLGMGWGQICWSYIHFVHGLSSIPQSTRYTGSFHPFAVFIAIRYWLKQQCRVNNDDSLLWWRVDCFHCFSLIFVYYICVPMCLCFW